MNCIAKTIYSTIKALENTLTKNRRLKIESLTKLDDYFTICQYKTEEPRNIEISAPISLGSVLVWNKHVFPRSKMTVFQTYNKQYGIKIVAVWLEILQLHRCIIMVITWLYLKKEKKNFQSIEKHRENKYACSFSFTQPFVIEILSSWRFSSADAWPAWSKMLCMICYMLRCTHLCDRYDKSDFFFSDFISLLSCFRCISAKSSKQYYFRFPNKYFFCYSYSGWVFLGLLMCPFFENWKKVP